MLPQVDVRSGRPRLQKNRPLQVLDRIGGMFLFVENNPQQHVGPVILWFSS
jgi:hypothetical protein